jgi:plastocyanin
MTKLRTLGLILAVAAGLAAAGCGDGLPTPSASTSGGGTSTGGGGVSCSQCGTVVSGAAPTVTVDATDQDQFSPKTAHIKVGDVIEWKNTGVQTHSVTFDSDPAITRATLNGGETFEVKFTKAGNFYYYCTFHLSLGMTGYIDVASS